VSEAAQTEANRVTIFGTRHVRHGRLDRAIRSGTGDLSSSRSLFLSPKHSHRTGWPGRAGHDGETTAESRSPDWPGPTRLAHQPPVLHTGPSL